MRYLLGIDVGTSSTKVLVIDETGKKVSLGRFAYDISIPNTGYAEQDAQMLYESTIRAMCTALHSKEIRDNIVAVGITGQMHGLVTLDKDFKPVRPVIIWADQRTEKQVRSLKAIGIEKNTLNPAATGFLLPSLMWVKENEHENYMRIQYVMLPKDYIRYCLTGQNGTDYSDASGTLLFDPIGYSWDEATLQQTGLNVSMFPSLHHASDISGGITEEVAGLIGLKAGIPVVYGGGDTPMQLTGNGVIEEGQLSTNIGTASQINCICKRAPNAWKHLNAFHHIPDHLWISVGASLNGGIVLKWAKNTFLGKDVEFSDLDRLAQQSVPGSNGIVFLPFICGERAPYLDPNAKGILFGLTLSNSKADIIRSIMESVVYSFRDCMEVFKAYDLLLADEIVASGGGAKSPIWLQMQADILKKKIRVNADAVEAAKGAAITAGVGIGIYKDFEDAVAKTVDNSSIVFYPNPENFETYDERFATYQALYRNNRELF